jgi:hypothetical protein
MHFKPVTGMLLSILLLISIAAAPLFVITVSLSQTASADSTQENFTIVALPDTQFYSQSYPWIFDNQTEWIVQNENALNIVYVSHLGDVVETNNAEFQWINADNAMSVLDNAKVPYGILPGNHDFDGGPSPIKGAGATLYEKYFPASKYDGRSYWGGSYDSTSVTGVDASIGISFIPTSPNMNNYQLFTWDGMKFITLSLQYNPPADVLSWADNVLSKYSDRRAIISTHSYLMPDASWATGGPNIWKYVVQPENNVFLVLCGHEYDQKGYGAAEKVDNLNGRMVYQLLSDYQDLAQGGNGWLRIMKFVPSENMIYVQTYSPYLDNYWNDSANQFELYYPMSPAGATNGGISLMVYVGAIIVIVVVIGAVLLIKKPF